MTNPHQDIRLRLGAEHMLALRIMAEDLDESRMELLRWGVRLLWTLHRRGLLRGPWRILRGAKRQRRRRKKGQR